MPPASLVGVLGRADLIRALKQLGPDAKVADAMTAEVPTISHRACLEEAIRLLQEKQAPAVGVVDAERQARRLDHVGNDRRNADGARGAAARRACRPVEPARRGVGRRTRDATGLSAFGSKADVAGNTAASPKGQTAPDLSPGQFLPTPSRKGGALQDEVRRRQLAGLNSGDHDRVVGDSWITAHPVRPLPVIWMSLKPLKS